MLGGLAALSSFARGLVNRYPGAIGGLLLLAAASVSASWVTGAAAQAAEREQTPKMVAFVRSPNGWVAHGSRYVLTVHRTGLATLESSGGLPYTSFPLAATGQGSSLAGASTTVIERAGALSVTERLGGRVASLVRVRAARSGVLVRASIGTSVQGAASAPSVDFLSDGSRGLALGDERAGWTPQSGLKVPPREEYMRLPFWSGVGGAINGHGANAFGPPPLDLALDFPAGWLGIGLVQIPNASVMNITADGGVRINYPVATLGGISDAGSGGSFGRLVRFPELELTFGPNPYGVLASYGHLLARLDGSVDRSHNAPLWWRRPLVDTFGQQALDRVTNAGDSSRYTAAYVQQFARSYQQRFGVRHATLVIDATWQQNPGPRREVSDPLPGRLFGGYAGMRQLIDSLHRSGFKVLLWWHSWYALPGSYADRMGVVHGGCRANPCPPGSNPYGTIDPTSRGFPAYVQAVTRRLLGSGRGDLNADGLKMDYTFLMPRDGPWSDPALGIGLAASHRYFATFHHYAHLVKPSALLTASIAAPQFADAVDEIRLNDAATVGNDSSEAKWQARARVAAAAHPGALIDSDGWATDAQAAVEHFLTAAVYGVPELDFVSAWPNGPLDAAEARLIGQIQALAATRPAGGSPVYASTDHWLNLRHGVVVAETLRSAQPGSGLAGVDIWTGKRIHLLATIGTSLAVPLHGAAVESITAGGRRLPWHVEGPRVVVPLQVGEEATVALAHRSRACRSARRCARGW